MIDQEQTSNYFGANCISSNLKSQIIDAIWGVLGDIQTIEHYGYENWKEGTK